MADEVQKSPKYGVPPLSPLPEEDDVEFKAGGSSEVNPHPGNPGGTAATHQPPAERAPKE